MPVITRKYVHEVERNGNLFFLCNGFNGALNKLAEQLGGGLQAIALALSTPKDNSAEIKALTDKLKQSEDVLQSAIDQAKKGK